MVLAVLSCGTMAFRVRQTKFSSSADKRADNDYFVTMARNDDELRTDHASDPAASLAALVARAERAGKGAPPVERWNPPYCGDIDMEIRADGTWFYMGTPIGRMPLVRLFSTVLRKDDDGKTYLVTPVERIGIRIEDAPFVAVEMDAADDGDQQVLTFRTNVGDVVEAGPDHPLRFAVEANTGGVKPYLHVRGRLEALLARPLLYQLVDRSAPVLIDGTDMMAVRSNGAVFPIMSLAELERLSR
jgi:hypothetical protein